MHYKHKYYGLILHIVNIIQFSQTTPAYIGIASMDTSYTLECNLIEIMEKVHLQIISMIQLDWGL